MTVYNDFDEWFEEMEETGELQNISDDILIAMQMAWEQGYKSGATWMKDTMKEVYS